MTPLPLSRTVAACRRRVPHRSLLEPARKVLSHINLVGRTSHLDDFVQAVNLALGWRASARATTSHPAPSLEITVLKTTLRHGLSSTYPRMSASLLELAR
eukprot:4979689-Pleurochrysis_carterae.AAC.3